MHCLLSLVFLLSFLPALLLADDMRVFQPPRRPDDVRLEPAMAHDKKHSWTPPSTLAAWRQRAAVLRRQLLVTAGLWPMPPGAPLKPVVHGKIDRGEYTIEKVFLQSYPGVYVTGNLYRPVGRSGKRPAVLCPHGHWRDGRFMERTVDDAEKERAIGAENFLAGARYLLQARCVQLARMGCVVFHYDMIGYADSGAQFSKHIPGLVDVESQLRLQTSFGLQTYGSIRALDFLLSLPDVDTSRVGVTGASGGGTQTFILCALDQRPTAAFPAVMISAKYHGGCVCENAPHLRVGTANLEIAALFAPRPMALSGADDWTIDIETEGLPELKQIYGVYGVPDLVHAVAYPQFKHNYNQRSRELMYGWFNVHLRLGVSAPVIERDFEPVSPRDLRVFDDSHPLPSDAVDIPELSQRLTAMSDKQLAELRPRDGKGLDEFRRIVGGGLEAILHTSLPDPSDVELKQVSAVEEEAATVRTMTLTRKGGGEEVPAILLTPKSWNGVVVVVVSADGKAMLGRAERSSRELDRCLERGAAVLSPDVFLVGEYLNRAPQDDPNAEDFDAANLFPVARRHKEYPGFTWGYNRTLIAQRVHDILTAVAGAKSLPGTRAVHLAGVRGAGGWVVLASALAGDAVRKTVAETSLDFGAIVSFDDPDYLPGALKYGGMPFFTALCSPRELRLVSDSAVPEVVPKVVRDAYAAAGPADAVRAVNSERGLELAEWVSQ